MRRVLMYDTGTKQIWPKIMSPRMVSLDLVEQHPGSSYQIEQAIRVSKSTMTGTQIMQSLSSTLNTHLLSKVQHRVSTFIVYTYQYIRKYHHSASAVETNTLAIISTSLISKSSTLLFSLCQGRRCSHLNRHVNPNFQIPKFRGKSSSINK